MSEESLEGERARRVLRERVAADWAVALDPVAEIVARELVRLRAEAAAGMPSLPAEPLVLRAFERPLADVRVVIVGQDPYPTPGHAIGLSFAVDAPVRPLPRSLANIYRELQDDVGLAPAEHGDLSGWSAQGVLLLNRVLSVAPGRPGAHRDRGWKAVTARALEALASRGGPIVAVLWGKDAAEAAPLLGTVPIVASAHPSPLSARRGFFGSRPFSRVNTLLAEQGAQPIDWRVGPVATAVD
jgi:uracil-DNA glycosylase